MGIILVVGAIFVVIMIYATRAWSSTTIFDSVDLFLGFLDLRFDGAIVHLHHHRDEFVHIQHQIKIRENKPMHECVCKSVSDRIKRRLEQS